jgi:citronellyl-CoA dehydrogenase
MRNMTDEHRAFQDLTHRFIAAEINPYAAEWEGAGEFPTHELFRKMGNIGLLGINKPVEYGGLGLDYSYQAVFAESLGKSISSGVCLAIGVQTDMATPALAWYGSDRVKREFLQPSISGERVACIGLSETTAGSDLAAIKTTAIKKAGDYIINGGKMWTTNATKADWMCLLANTSAPRSTPGRAVLPLDKSLICVPLDAVGVTVGPKLRKLGMHASDTAQFFFDDVRVPESYLIGQEGKGFLYQMRQFGDERLFVCLSSIASMQDTLERTVEYCRSRHVFGRPIVSFQAAQFRLADLFSKVQTLRAHAWRTVEDYVDGKDIALESAILKLRTGRLVRELNDECLQMWGGMGFMEDSVVARRYRDQRLVAIGGGAEEVMLGIIAGYMNLTKRHGGERHRGE